MTGPRLTDRTEAGVAFLDDARKRRKRRRPKPAVPVAVGEPHGPEFDVEDSSGYATDLADGLLDEQPEAVAGGADEILAQHEAAAAARESTVVVQEGTEDAPADEILLALESHHERAEPRQRQLTPRGSVDLDAHHAQRPRAKPTPTWRKLTRPRPSRRVLAGGAVAAVLIAIATTIGSASPGTTSKTADQLAPVTANTVSAAFLAGNFPAHGQLAATHRQTTSAKHASKSGQHHPGRTKKSAPSHSTTSAPPSSSGTPASTAANSTPQQSYSTTPAASDSQASRGSSSSSSGGGGTGAQSAPSAGPNGTGSILGPGHCGC